MGASSVSYKHNFLVYSLFHLSYIILFAEMTVHSYARNMNLNRKCIKELCRNTKF